MFKINNYFDSENIVSKQSLGSFEVIEHQRDLSLGYGEATEAFFAHKMGVKARQLICNIQSDRCGVTLQAGDMQWFIGSLNVATGVKGVGDFFSKMAKGAVTGEGAIKPQYKGDGILATEPTYKHIILFDNREWKNSVVLEDGLFLACEDTLNHKIQARKFNSSVASGEGLFNLKLEGDGVFAVESAYPREELIEFELNNDTLKIDSNMAIAWSSTLELTVERTTKTLIGSAASGEGLVNVYRGTGKVLMAPFQKVYNTLYASSED